MTSPFYEISSVLLTHPDGDDYTHIKEFMSLPTFDGKMRSCYKVTIFDDDTIEESERFSVQLDPGVSTPSNVHFHPQQTQVLIVDDEIGMYVVISLNHRNECGFEACVKNPQNNGYQINLCWSQCVYSVLCV